MKRTISLILFLVLSSQFLILNAKCYSGEIDAIVIVTGVHDGDTFYINRKLNGSNTIRLADVDTAELGQPNSTEARNLLAGLVSQSIVYLDIEDKSPLDSYDRLICVVYADLNDTHYLNVNKALLNTGLAEEKDYDNEFDPSTWTLYVPKEDIVPEYPSFLILFLITIVLVVIACGKKLCRQSFCLSLTL